MYGQKSDLKRFDVWQLVQRPQLLAIGILKYVRETPNPEIVGFSRLKEKRTPILQKFQK